MEEDIYSTVAQVAATDFIEEIEKKQKEHLSWYGPIESDLEDMFGVDMEAALRSARTILSKNPVARDHLIEFADSLQRAGYSCVKLASFYEYAKQTPDVDIVNEFYGIIERTRRKVQNHIDNYTPERGPVLQNNVILVGNVTFRLGSLQDSEIRSESDLIVLPISTTGEVSKDMLPLAGQLNMNLPKGKLLLGQISVIPFTFRKTNPLFGAWACSFTEKGGSSYAAIENICKELVEVSYRYKINVISLPLFGSGDGTVDPLETAKIYTKHLNQQGGKLKFIVSVSAEETFLRVRNYFIQNGDVTDQPDGPAFRKKATGVQSNRKNAVYVRDIPSSLLASTVEATAENQAKSPPPPMPPDPPRPSKDQPDIKSRLISDTFTADETDVLQYDVIAQNLFAILTDKGTNPPLNIGIFAPWGRGKTSLMKRLQVKFDEARETELKAQNRTPKKLAGWKALLHWLRSDEIDVKPQLPYATVWFNPWNYQSSDMIWAGMADAVIEQVVGQIPSKTEREVFWMQLRLARLAREKIRKDIQTRLLLYFLQLFTWGIFILLAILFYTLNKAIPWGLVGAGTISGLVTTLVSRINPLSTSISESFDKYSEAPKYQDKTGTFHEVQADLNKVLDLCLDEKRPMVIFVDDLDRCSPSKVVEVVEAINVFINGRYNNKCYFILGMDGEMVAGALDVSYEKMKGKLGSREIDQGSIGWYFLDKFIQLPYFIPVMSESKKKEYLRNLLSEKEGPGNGMAGANVDDGGGNNGGAAAKPPEPVNEAKVKEVAEKVIATSDNQESSQLIKEASLSREEQKELDKLILQNQVESQKQNEIIMEQVGAYAPYISSDPRSLKRFANLLRFYCAYQFLRMKKGQPYVEAPILAKWLAIMLKFPQLVRWIQWDSENKAGIHTAAEEKVKLLDELLEGYCKDAEDQEFSRWLAHALPVSFGLNGKPVSISDYPEMPWLRSRKLFDILMNEKAGDSSFRNTLECNVW